MEHHYQMLYVEKKLNTGTVFNRYFSIIYQAWMANFERPQLNANSLLASSIGLSPYLRFGCLSSRLFYLKLTEVYKEVLTQSIKQTNKPLFGIIIIIVDIIVILKLKVIILFYCLSIFLFKHNIQYSQIVKTDT